MELSAAIERIEPSPTLAVSARAAELKRQGRDILQLSTGEPDFPTPQSVKDAAIAAILAENNYYTAVAGTLRLREAVAAKFARENGLDYHPDDIIVTTGGKQAIFNAILTTVDQGDEVIVPAPYWVSYPDIVQLAGGTPVFVPTDVAAGFKLDPEALERAITPRTRWFILNSPCNPTGAAYSASELRAFADVLARHPHVWVLSDDMYEHIIYDGLEFVTIAQAAPELFERTLTLNGASKAFSMTGWRIGYAGGPRRLIRAMVKAQSQSTSNACTIAQAAVVGGLTGDLHFLAERRAVFQERRDLIVGRLNAIEGLSCPTPKGAFYAYVDASALMGRRRPDGGAVTSDEELAAYLLDEGVAVVHGAAFGLSPAFRVSYATDTPTIERACDRIARACERLR